MNRGLLVLAVAALALPLAAASARAPRAPSTRLVELVVTLENRNQDAFVRRLQHAVPGARVRWRYRLVLNGLAVIVPEASAKRIAALPGVDAVYPSVRYRRTLYRSPQVIGAPQLWGPGLATAGNGIKIGIVDDGIDQTHRRGSRCRRAFRRATTRTRRPR